MQRPDKFASPGGVGKGEEGEVLPRRDSGVVSGVTRMGYELRRAPNVTIPLVLLSGCHQNVRLKADIVRIEEFGN